MPGGGACWSFDLTDALFVARNHWSVRTDSRLIAEVVASLAWLARFLLEANWSRVKIAIESVWKFVEIVQNRNGTTYFYRTRIKEPVIIKRIKSSSNLWIFRLCFFVVSCWLHASGAFFACCLTCNVSILSHIMRACSMSSESTLFTVGICLLSLIFF